MLRNQESGFARSIDGGQDLEPEVIQVHSDNAVHVYDDLELEEVRLLSATASSREDVCIISEILDNSEEFTTKTDSRDALRVALDDSMLRFGEMGVEISDSRVTYLGSLGQKELMHPFSVKVSTAGELVVTDRPLNMVFKFSLDGELLAHSDKFNEPMGLFCQDDMMWLCDKENRRLVMLDEALNVAKEISLDDVLGRGFSIRRPAFGCHKAGRFYVIATDAKGVDRRVISFNPEAPESTWTQIEVGGFSPHKVKVLDGQLCFSRFRPSAIFAFDKEEGSFHPYAKLDLVGYLYGFTSVGKDLVLAMDKYLQFVCDKGGLVVDVADITGVKTSRAACVEVMDHGADKILLVTDLYQGCVHKFLYEID